MAYLGHIEGPHPNHPWAKGMKITFRPKPVLASKATSKQLKHGADKKDA